MAQRVDMMGATCVICASGIYQETSINDDMDGVLHCNECEDEIDRYQKTKIAFAQEYKDIVCEAANEDLDDEELCEYLRDIYDEIADTSDNSVDYRLKVAIARMTIGTQLKEVMTDAHSVTKILNKIFERNVGPVTTIEHFDENYLMLIVDMLTAQLKGVH